jgi:hypothetical protein
MIFDSIKMYVGGRGGAYLTIQGVPNSSGGIIAFERKYTNTPRRPCVSLIWRCE